MTDTFGLSVDDYIEADRVNLESVRRDLPHFSGLVPTFHALYQRSQELVPADQPVYGRALLLSHKSFLSAAVTVARMHPDDAAATTRRAVEAARICLAIKANPDNLEHWKNAEHRLERWTARREGRRPGRLHDKVEWPNDHPLMEPLMRLWGSFSDLYVHFTPEFVAGQAWKHEAAGEDLVDVQLPFHDTNVQRTASHLVLLAKVHLHILSVMDTCLDFGLSGDSEWERRRRVVHGSIITFEDARA